MDLCKILIVRGLSQQTTSNKGKTQLENTFSRCRGVIHVEHVWSDCQNWSSSDRVNSEHSVCFKVTKKDRNIFALVERKLAQEKETVCVRELATANVSQKIKNGENVQ